ncbi:MAG: GGDEF domain-containing protein [Bariatricus sp.]
MGKNRWKDKLSGIIPKVYIILCIATVLFLIWMAAFQNVEVFQKREHQGFSEMTAYQVQEIQDEDTPIGIKKEYTWILDKSLVNDNCLAFYIVHQYAEVYIDDELVYSLFPKKSNVIGKTSANNYIVIPLYDTDVGKEVRVEIIPVYRSVLNRPVNFFIGSEHQIYLHRLKQDLPTLILCMTAIVVGVILIVLAFIQYHRKETQTNQIYLGMFSVIVGMWKITDTRFSPFLFSKNTLVLSYITLMMLVLAPVAMMLFLQGEFKLKDRRVFNIVECGAVGTGFVVLALQILNIMDLRESLYAIHIMLVICIAAIVYMIACEWKKKRDNIKVKAALGCLSICVVGAFVDLIFYYVRGSSSGILYTLAAFILYAVVAGIMSNRELGLRANLDLHTGLYNKSRCRELFETESIVREKCAVVMFDLNHLKRVNDTMGHEEGDRLIRGFAEILKNNFPSKAFVARYGGDEFVAVVKVRNSRSVEEILKGIREEVIHYNERTDGAEISYAVGYAVSTEYSGMKLQELLEIADQNMYQDKKKYHQNDEESI